MLNINDVIKVLENIQEDITVGSLGTVVCVFDVFPPVYEIEFTDNEGRTIVTVPLKEEEISLYWIASTRTYVDKP